MTEIKWRFPGNNYTAENGLNTSDMETFKKDPIASLAREICQNSIDARDNYNKPVLVEFNLFEVDKQSVPGLSRISEEIKSCQQEWRNHKAISMELKDMEYSLLNEKLKVLRISDFNTWGLKGVSTTGKTPWYLLTKGSGISDKVDTAGGSKGIGKYATFVASEINTVFYNTMTVNNEVGYQGICKLCSTSIKGTDEKTQGIGYFGVDNKNLPILESFSLDNEFVRNEFGTDIYIIAFRMEQKWKEEIITKILDSFMVAIVKNDLVIKVQGIIISKDTLKNVVYSNNYILKNSRKNILSQYILLTDNSVYKEPIEIENYGQAILYLKAFKKDDFELATNNCVMIRYPYMKIKTRNNISNIPCSAMCIIENNNLNKALRELENPQHTNWENKRIHNLQKRKEVKRILNELYKKINEIVNNQLISGNENKTDIEGASEYLPDEYNQENNGVYEDIIVSETPILYKSKKNENIDEMGYKDDLNGKAIEPEIGDFIEGEEGPITEGENNNNNGEYHPGNEDVGIEENGDKDILRYANLAGFQYKFFVINKDMGEFAIVFTSPINERDVEMELLLVDDSGHKHSLEILFGKCNGIECEIKDNKRILLELKKNKKYNLSLNLNEYELFACEVRMYARR